jgi:hypothetical protein
MQVHAAIESMLLFAKPHCSFLRGDGSERRCRIVVVPARRD